MTMSQHDNERCPTCEEEFETTTRSSYMGRYGTCANGHTWSLA